MSKQRLHVAVKTLTRALTDDDLTDYDVSTCSSYGDGYHTHELVLSRKGFEQLEQAVQSVRGKLDGDIHYTTAEDLRAAQGPRRRRMSGHTPGPWEATPLGIRSGLTRVALVSEVCRPDKDLLDRETMGANARLIAAAPTLLEALEACWAWRAEFERHMDDHEVEFIEAALACGRREGE